MRCRGLVIIYGQGRNLSVGYVVHHDGPLLETKINMYDV
jgi:hypothetical protein